MAPPKEPPPHHHEPLPPLDIRKVVKNRKFIRTVRAESNTHYQDCIFASREQYGVDATGVHDVLFERCEFTGAKGKGLKGSGFRAQNCRFHDIGADGVFIDGNDTTLVGCHFSKLGVDPTSHADAVQIGLGQRNKILNCTFVVPNEPGHTSNACIFAKADFGKITDLEINGNLFDGGGYCVQVLAGRRFPKPTDVRVERNTFLRYYYGTHRGFDQDTISKDVSRSTSKNPPG